ncbi:hypothetical protein QYF61_011995 [Mycteria americana]|uniref:Uncharacterized protein n=1 Tax=Mycteria americana TaxID=33587 RepID=A0AAN7SED6_MYCAM|nr:hypothetical protein QYF61_011995 [Mycteria americana]
MFCLTSHLQNKEELILGCMRLRELADVIARLLSVNFERSEVTWEGKAIWGVSQGPEKENVTSVFKKVKNKVLENCRLVTLTSIPSKVMEQVILETISKHMKDKKVIGRSQHEFMKRKLCLTNWIALYDEMTGLVNDGRAPDVIYLNFRRNLLQCPIKSS